jgi:hypothetical protein
LPTTSRIDWETRDDGSVLVIERLDGRGEAIGAIAFALFMLVYLAVFIGAYLKAGTPADGRFVAALLGTFWVLELSVLVPVVDRTWRKTILEASRHRLRLEFRAIGRRRRYEWPTVDGGELCIVQTQTLSDGQPLAELQIRPAAELTVRLFTDHSQRQLDVLVNELIRAMDGKAEEESANYTRDQE